MNNSQFKFLNVYPNPTNDKITVEFDYSNESIPDNILLFDILGNQLYQHEITDLISKTITLDVSRFESGLYFLVLRSNNLYSIPFDIIIQ